MPVCTRLVFFFLVLYRHREPAAEGRSDLLYHFPGSDLLLLFGFAFLLLP